MYIKADNIYFWYYFFSKDLCLYNFDTHTLQLLYSLIINYHNYELINELLPICHMTEKHLWFFFLRFHLPTPRSLKFSLNTAKKIIEFWTSQNISRNPNPLQYFHGKLISEDFQLVFPKKSLRPPEISKTI